MQSVLIAHASEEFTQAISARLSGYFQIMSCADGITAEQIIRSQKPDILIIGLHLPYRDGLSILENVYPNRPPVILATILQESDYIKMAHRNYGIGYVMIEPCDIQNAILRITDMLYYTKKPQNSMPAPEERTSKLLLRLGIPSGRDGFSQLRAGIPLYAQDTTQRLSKELYPAIAKICGFGNGELVEHSIRKAIEDAWKNGDAQIWDAYFPPKADGTRRCPTNKAFISRMAAILSVT